MLRASSYQSSRRVSTIMLASAKKLPEGRSTLTLLTLWASAHSLHDRCSFETDRATGSDSPESGCFHSTALADWAITSSQGEYP
jgi:hypothetical protein